MDYYLFYTTLVSLESNEKDTSVFAYILKIHSKEVVLKGNTKKVC